MHSGHFSYRIVVRLDEISAPIWILPCLVKILEKCAFTTTSSFIDKHNLMAANLYLHCWPKHTAASGRSYIDDLNYGFEHNMCTCACFHDASKVFDTITHFVLLNKRSAIGFRGPFSSLLNSFFSDRSQTVFRHYIHRGLDDALSRQVYNNNNNYNNKSVVQV